MNVSNRAMALIVPLLALGCFFGGWYCGIKRAIPIQAGTERANVNAHEPRPAPTSVRSELEVRAELESKILGTIHISEATSSQLTLNYLYEGRIDDAICSLVMSQNGNILALRGLLDSSKELQRQSVTNLFLLIAKSRKENPRNCVVLSGDSTRSNATYQVEVFLDSFK